MKFWTAAALGLHTLHHPHRGTDHAPELDVRDAHGLRVQGTDREAEVAATFALKGSHEGRSRLVYRVRCATVERILALKETS